MEHKYKCVQCGYCCSKGPCSYGKVNAEYKCIFLIPENEELGTFSCAAKDAIKEKEKDSKYPMFNNYCSSSMFNTVRDAVIEKMNK